MAQSEKTLEYQTPGNPTGTRVVTRIIGYLTGTQVLLAGFLLTDRSLWRIPGDVYQILGAAISIGGFVIAIVSLLLAIFASFGEDDNIILGVTFLVSLLVAFVTPAFMH